LKPQTAISLAWSEYRRGSWSAKKVSRDVVSVPLYLQLDPGSPAATPRPPTGNTPFGPGWPWPTPEPSPPPSPAVPATYTAQDADRSSLYFEVEAGQQIEIRCCSRPASALPTPEAEEDVPHESRIDEFNAWLAGVSG